MRATAVARVPGLLLPLFLFLVLYGNTRIFIQGGVDGEVGPDGVELCTDATLEDQDLGVDPDVDLANTCLRMSFCTGVGLDSMTQRVCPPID